MPRSNDEGGGAGPKRYQKVPSRSIRSGSSGEEKEGGLADIRVPPLSKGAEGGEGQEYTANRGDGRNGNGAYISVGRAGEHPRILKGGVEPTRHRNVFRVGINDEDLATRMCLHYARENGASIDIIHAPPKGDKIKETVIKYFTAQELRPLTGFREESITLEILATGDYVISDRDIMAALKDIKLKTIGKIHRPAMGKSCPVQSNKRIIHVIPPGHNPEGGGKTLTEAATMFNWPHYLKVQLNFEDDGGSQPAPIYLNYKIYADGTNNDLGLCKGCHKKEGHAKDCELVSNTVDTLDEYTAKLLARAKKTKDAHDVAKPCKWYLFGLCKFQNKCKMVHDEGVPANMIGCALPKAKKHTLLKIGLPKNAIVCAGGGTERCMYSHQEWAPELNTQMLETIKADPSVLGE